MKKILILAGFDQSLVNFRGPLLAALAKAGHHVTGVAPKQTPEVPEKLAALGARFLPVRLARTGLNPLRDFGSICQLKTLLRREHPDVVLSYTIKPVIYGSLAAGWVGVPRIYALITGLGAAFHTAGPKGWWLRWVAIGLYRVALRRCHSVIVQNRDIADLFIREEVVPEQKIIVVAGSGIDTNHFKATPLPDGPPVFLLLARMLWDKGVGEFVAAARIVKIKFPQARFVLVGAVDPNPAAISQMQLDEWNDEGVIEYRSAVRDVRPLLAECSAYVLPSYHEGLPRSVLEAMATGRPVITTDVIGCKETIIAAGPADAQGIRTGQNGMLVPLRSVEPLAVAMLRLIDDAVLGASMGRLGRQIVERQFDVRRINQQMLEAMDLLPANAPSPERPAASQSST